MNASTLNRIERIKALQRDERRAELVRAEAELRAAKEALEARRRDHQRATDAFRAVVVLTPAELELGARHLVETSHEAARAERVHHEREHQRVSASTARVEAERDVRGIGIAKVRLARVERARDARAEAQILELRAGRSR